MFLNILFDQIYIMPDVIVTFFSLLKFLQRILQDTFQLQKVRAAVQLVYV